MDGHQSGQQYRNHIQSYLGSKESTFHVSQDYGLFLHVPADADSDCCLRWSFHICKYHAQANGRFRTVGSYHEIPDTAHTFCTDLDDVHGTLYLYAEYQSEIQACIHCRYPGRNRLSDIPILIYQQPGGRIKIQCHLR